MPFFTNTSLISMFSVGLLLVSIVLFLIVLILAIDLRQGICGGTSRSPDLQEGFAAEVLPNFLRCHPPHTGWHDPDRPPDRFPVWHLCHRDQDHGGMDFRWASAKNVDLEDLQAHLYIPESASPELQARKTLEATLEIPLDHLISIVVFAGSAKLKTRMPENVVRLNGLLRLIRSRQDVVFSQKEVKEMAAKIEALRLRRSLKTRRAHIRHVQEIVAEKARRGCPLCAGKMERQVVSGGKLGGQKFWGCLRFPDCRGVIVIDPKEPA